MILIKGGKVYAPNNLGVKDILIAGGKIEAIADKINIVASEELVEVIDASGHYVVPGFIDSHVHVLGGGGEGGFATRTPEIQLTQLTTSGITTVVGCLGTDGVTRSMASLIAKVRGLEEEGISAYCYTGSYDVPVRTLMNSPKEDIVLIDKIIGVGEIAISDHRSSQPTIDELKRIASEARVGGILSGKAGVINVHIGDGKRMLSALLEIVDTTEIPISQFMPTHINRNTTLFNSGIEFAKGGGYVDLTTSSDPLHLEDEELRASVGLRRLLEAGVDIVNIGFSSDAQGSLPIFNSSKELIGLGIGSTKSLFREVRDSVLQQGIPLEEALKVITSNPARILKLKRKGLITKGSDADLVFLKPDALEIDNVIAMGKIMVQQGKPIVKGTFE